MAIIYHAMSLPLALKAAERGSIWSPWENWMIDLQKIKEGNPNGFERIAKGRSIEDVALELASNGVYPRDIQNEVKSVPICTKLEKAVFYASQFEKFNGGLILGVDFAGDITKYLTNGTLYFIPRELKLTNPNKIAELYVSQTAKDSIRLIRKVFEKYIPRDKIVLL